MKYMLRTEACFKEASTQNQLNDIVMSWPNALEIKQDTNNSKMALIATDINGDIGITSENCELTVFGLGAHSHYHSHSPTNEIDEIRDFLTKISIFIDDLIHCRIAVFGVYSNGIDPHCGGFGTWENDTLFIRYTPKADDRITIRLHGQIEKTILHSQVYLLNPG